MKVLFMRNYIFSHTYLKKVKFGLRVSANEGIFIRRMFAHGDPPTMDGILHYLRFAKPGVGRCSQPHSTAAIEIFVPLSNGPHR